MCDIEKSYFDIINILPSGKVGSFARAKIREGYRSVMEDTLKEVNKILENEKSIVSKIVLPNLDRRIKDLP